MTVAAPPEDYLQLDEMSLPSETRSHDDCDNPFTALEKRHSKCLHKFTNNELLKKDSNGETVMHHAARTQQHEVITFLMDKLPSLNGIVSPMGEVPAHISAALGDFTAVEQLLGGPLRRDMLPALTRDVNGTSILMASVARGDNQLSFWLLNRFGKAIATLENNSHMLPIHVAAAQGNLEFLRAVTKYDGGMVKARDEFGCTAVVYAVQAGCLTSVRFLIENARSEIGIVSSRGQSLLHISCLCGHELVTKWLLSRMSSDAILWQSKEQANAIHCAAYSGSVAVLTMLLAKFSTKKCRSVLSLRDQRGNSPLHLAAINNHMDAARYMLENGADPQLVNTSGLSAQGAASLRGHPQMAELIASYIGSKPNKKRFKSAASTVAPALVIPPQTHYQNSPVSPLAMSRQSPATAMQSRPVSAGGNVRSGADSRISFGAGARSGAESRISFGAGARSGAESRGSFAPTRASLSPRDLSSGYSSAAEMYADSVGSGGIIERHRMRFVEEDGLKDSESQTETDSLKDRTKVLDDDRIWTGLGLSAVNEIDRILEEVDVLQLSPSL